MTLHKSLVVLTFLAGTLTSVTAGESPAYWEAVDRTAAKYEDPGLIPEESIRWLASEHGVAPDKVFLHLIQGRPSTSRERPAAAAAPSAAAAPAPMVAAPATSYESGWSELSDGNSMAQRVKARRALREAELEDEYSRRRSLRPDEPPPARLSPRAEREARRAAQRQARRDARERLKRDRAETRERARVRDRAEARDRAHQRVMAENRARADNDIPPPARTSLASNQRPITGTSRIDRSEYQADLYNLLRQYGTVGRTPIRPIESLAARQNKTPLEVLRDLMRVSKQSRY